MKKVYIFFCSAFLLSACVSAPVVQSPAELAGSHGYVYVNLPKGDSNTAIRLQSVRDGSEYPLTMRADTGIHAYGKWLPAGEYKLSKWMNYELGGYPPITVNAGQLTDLGSLIPFQLGGYEFVVLPIRHAEIAENVKAAITEYKPFLRTDKPIVWIAQTTPTPIKSEMQSTGLGLIADLLSRYAMHVNTPSINKQLREATSVQDFFQLAKAATPPLTGEVFIDEASNLYYGGDLGQIRVRSRDGKWTAIDTGTLHTVTSIERHDKFIVAGFSNGAIRASDDGGKTWRKIASIDKDESVVDIDRISKRWFIVTARTAPSNNGWQGVDQVKVYLANKEDLSDLSAIKQFTPTTPNYAASVRGQVSGNFYYVNAIPNLFRLDLTSMEWKTITPPTLVTAFNASAQTVAAYRIQGAFSKLYVSSDNGETWKQYDNPPYAIQDVYFETATIGQAARWRAGAFTATIELLRYQSSQDRWEKTHDAPAGCARVLSDGQNISKFCVTTGGTILSYTGNEWKVEFAAD